MTAHDPHVVRLDAWRRRAEAAAAATDALGSLQGAWDDARKGRDLPARADLDPEALGPVLDRILLIERVAPRVARIRLAGARIRDITGGAADGLPLSCLFDARAREPLGAAMQAMFDRPARVQLDLRSAVGLFRTAIPGRMLLLPMTDMAGRATQAAVALEPGTDTPPHTLRFAITGETRRSLVAGMPSRVRPDPSSDDGERLFDNAERAREVMRRRQGFHVVT